jgi:hypothetical protein
MAILSWVLIAVSIILFFSGRLLNMVIAGALLLTALYFMKDKGDTK